MIRTVTITSGKGGVGKTNISVNLALHLATLGYRTCLFDADLGLANINILLGLRPEYNLEDVLLHHYDLQDIIIKNYEGIDIIPGSSGTEKLANLENEQVEHLIRSFSELDGYDFLLFDTSAGVSRSVIAFCLASSEVVLVITPEPTSLTDAYALLKILSLNGFTGSVKIVVNQCKSAPIAKLIYDKFKKTVKKYLPIDVMPLGIVVQDKKVVEAVSAQQALMLLYPESNASKCIKNITKHLLENQVEDLENLGMASFWTRCIHLIKSPLNLTSSPKEEKRIEPESSIQEMQKGLTHQLEEDEQKSVPEESKDAEEPIQSSEETAEVAPTTLQSLEEEAPDVVTDDPAESGTTANIEQGIYLLLSKVIDSIASVSQELQLMRKAIENGGGNGFAGNRAVVGKQGPLPHKSITLDFNAFLTQRSMDTGSEDNE
jgi:flagellar biosynthesis protein FlhG